MIFVEECKKAFDSRIGKFFKGFLLAVPVCLLFLQPGKAQAQHRSYDDHYSSSRSVHRSTNGRSYHNNARPRASYHQSRNGYHRQNRNNYHRGYSGNSYRGYHKQNDRKYNSHSRRSYSSHRNYRR